MKSAKLKVCSYSRKKEAEKKQALLDAFDFRSQDQDRTTRVVDEVDERIAALNS